MKSHFYKLPFRYFLFFLYHWLYLGSWRVGWVGYVWAKLRTNVMRQVEYKYKEMSINKNTNNKRSTGVGKPDKRVDQYK